MLNANIRVTRHSDFNAAGVAWEYRRSFTAETLSASGTLTEATTVEVLVGRNDNDVQFTYEYVVPKPTTQTPTTQQPTTKAPTTHPPTTSTTTPPTTSPATPPPTNHTPTTPPTTSPTTQTITTEATSTPQPMGPVNETFLATNQPFGEQQGR